MRELGNRHGDAGCREAGEVVGRRVPARPREAPQDISQSEGGARPSLGEPVTEAGSTRV